MEESNKRTFEKITDQEIAANGIQALANRPNKPSQYGQSGLSATELKKWFDNLTSLIANKVNGIARALEGKEAAKYIDVNLSTIETLYDLVKSFKDGSFAKELEVKSSLNSERQSLEDCINQLDAILARKVEKTLKDLLIVPDQPIDYEYINGTPVKDYETGESVTKFEPHAAINTNFADKRYGRKIAAEYDNQNGSLKICLQSLQNDEDDNEKNDKKETISECAVHLPLVKTTSIPDKLYGTDSDGEQKEYPVRHRDSNYTLDEKEMEDIITRGYVEKTNPIKDNLIYFDTDNTSNVGDMNGWYRIAMIPGEGSRSNIFQLHIMSNQASGTGGDAAVIFSVARGEWSGYPSISVLNFSYRKSKIVQAIRVINYNDKSASIDVHIKSDYSLKRLRFTTQTLLRGPHFDKETYPRQWVLLTPQKITEEPSNVACETIRSTIDNSWSDVNVTTEYLNNLPTKINELENKIANSGGSSSEWDYVLDVYSPGPFWDNKILIVDINVYEIYCNVVELLIHTDYDGYHDVELVTIRFSQREPGNLSPSILTTTANGATFEQDSEYNLRLKVPLSTKADGAHSTQVYIKEKLYKYPGIYSAHYVSE